MEKPQIRKLFRKIAQQNIHNPVLNITEGLNTQFAILIKRLEKEKQLGNRIIGSYISLSKQEIEPPVFEGFGYAYPRFDKKMNSKEVPLMEFKVLSDLNTC